LTEVRCGRGRYPLPPTSTNEQWQYLADMLDRVELGQPVVAATVVRTRGSTPRKPGAKMLLSPDGSVRGTIGGGCGEAAVRSEAMMLFDFGAAPLQDGVPAGYPGRVGSWGGHVVAAKLVSVTMDADVDAEGMACGGVMDVFLERLV
jgi:xanthine dehydrogenase accessory factor